MSKRNPSDASDTSKIFCLFHNRIDCPCIRPVTTRDDLRARLIHQINLLRFQVKFSIDDDKTQKNKEIESLQNRLDIMEKETF